MNTTEFHPTHNVRPAINATAFNYICKKCFKTDRVEDTSLAKPCTGGAKFKSIRKKTKRK